MTDPGTYRLVEALEAWSRQPTDATLAGVHAALVDATVLLPVRAVAVAETVAERTGLPAEREAELSLLTVTLAGGRRVLPVFTGTDDLRRWRLEARPVQAPLRSACRAVLDEGWSGLVVDPATHGFVVASAVAAALAEGALPVLGPGTGEPLRSGTDLADALRRGVAREPTVAAAWLLATEPVTLGLRLKVPLDDRALATIAGRLGRRLDPSGLVRPLLQVLDPADEPAEGRLWP